MANESSSKFKINNSKLQLCTFHVVLLTVILLYSGLTPTVFAQVPSVRPAGRTTPIPTPLVPDESPTTGINLTLSPVFLNLFTDPDTPISSSVRIRNNSNTPEYLEIGISKFTTGPDGSPVIVDLEQDDAFASWVSFSDPEFTLAPTQTKTVRITINPPKDAALGYYYAFVFNRIREVEGRQSAVVAGAPALPVLLTVNSPNAKRDLQIVDFKTDKLFYEYLPTTFTVTMKNTGNIHSVPGGDIFIDWMGKKDIAVLSVNTGKGNILPQGTRSFSATWNDGFAVRVPKTDTNGQQIKDKDGNVAMRTEYNFSKVNHFRIGKYTANVLMVYDNGERDVPLEATITFWVFPWKIVLVGTVIAIFALLGLKNTISSNIKRLRRLFHA